MNQHSAGHAVPEFDSSECVLLSLALKDNTIKNIDIDFLVPSFWLETLPQIIADASYMQEVEGVVPNLLVSSHTAQEHKDPICSPPGFITCLVHACVLFLPSAEWVAHIALCCGVRFAFVPTCQAGSTDVQLALLTCANNAVSEALAPLQDV